MLALIRLFLLSLVFWPLAAMAAELERPVVLLDIKGPIGPATSDYIHRSLEKAWKQRAVLVIVRIDTPGGLGTSMREIIQDVLASPVPIATYVAPSGARAASAGTYILYASHIAAMAPGTNLGAATPIQMGAPSPAAPRGRGGDMHEPGTNGEDGKGEGESTPLKGERPHPTLADKVVSDAVAYIRSLAQLRGRNADWAEKAVTEAASLPAEEALEAEVIDLLARNVTELLEKLDGRTVEVLDEEKVLRTAEVPVTTIEPDWRTEFLAVITNPNIAFFLLLLGFYGLIFEFTHPGAILPGVAGGISLLLALYALHVLPINFAGLGLILLGIAFMVAEAFVPAFGALGIGGVIAFVVGSVMLLDTDVPGFQISWLLITAVGGTSSICFVIVLGLAVRARHRPVVSGPEEMIGTEGLVLDWADGEGRVRAHGEIWRASATQSLEANQRVRVAGLEGLTLVVEPAKDREED